MTSISFGTAAFSTNRNFFASKFFNRIDFFVSNINQKNWIEQQTGAQMAAFLRKSLQNESVRLAVKIKSREDIQKRMYMPQDKDRYLTENNPEFAQLKKDLGAELK